MKRFFSLLLCLLMIPGMLLLTGCHGSRSLPDFVPPEEFDESRSYTVTFWAKNDTNKTQTRIYEKAIEDFQTLYPNITVNLRLYTDYSKIYNDVITNISTNTAFDSKLRMRQTDDAGADQQDQDGGDQTEAGANTPVSVLFLLLIAGFPADPIHYAPLQALRSRNGEVGSHLFNGSHRLIEAAAVRTCVEMRLHPRFVFSGERSVQLCA